MQETFSSGDLAWLFGVAPRTAKKWMQKGLLPHWVIPGGRERRCTRQALLEFAQAHDMLSERVLQACSWNVLLLTDDTPLAQRLGELLPPRSGFYLHRASCAFTAGTVSCTAPLSAALLDIQLGKALVSSVLQGLAHRREARQVYYLVIAGEDQGNEMATWLPNHFRGLFQRSIDSVRNVFYRPFDPDYLAERLVHTCAGHEPTDVRKLRSLRAAENQHAGRALQA